MKITERYLWIGAVILVAFAFQNQVNTSNNLETLLKTYDLETTIQKSEIVDFNNQLHAARDNSYVRGFEAGKTQAGIALAKDESLYDYKDGYHAALTHQVEESAIFEVSESLMFELNSLRRMVPRLLQQNEDLESNLASLRESDFLWNAIMDDLESTEDVDAVYLDIIDLLLEDSEQKVEVRAPSPAPHQDRFITKQED